MGIGVGDRKLGGLTRGLDFCGNLAFVGVSRVRESAVLSGSEITEKLEADERICGVWVIDISNCQVVAYLQFEDALQEIFAVCVLPGKRYLDLINDDQELTGETYVLPYER